MAKIAVVGPLDPDSFADNVAHTLRKMGHEVLALGPARPRPRSRRAGNLIAILGERLPRQDAFLQRALIRKAVEFRPELVVTLDRTLAPEAISAMHAIGARVVLWFPDHVANLGRHGVFLAGYDRIFFKNPVLVRQLVEIHGIAASYLPEAFNPDWHRPGTEFGTDGTLVLVGNIHPTRAILLDRLIRAGLPLTIYGPQPPSWIDFSTIREAHVGRVVHREEKARVFRSAAAVLNNLHPGEYAGVNCRMFEATGAGGAVLTEVREGFGECFDLGREIVGFESFDQLVDRARNLIDHREEGKAIGDRAAERAMRDHSYEKRLNEMLNNL